MNIDKKAKEYILKKGENVEGFSVRGYDFNQGVNYKKIVESFASTGHQATEFWRAVEMAKEMIKECDKIFLGYTSNMVSSGLRDTFRYLAEHKKIDVIVTSGGGIEEDIIKCLGDFKIGNFGAFGKELRKKAINRIGNIFASNNLYLKFEEFVKPVLTHLYTLQTKENRIILPSELINSLGKAINNKNSIYYWTEKNKIEVYSPSILDGSLGDMVYFFKHNQGKDFVLDIVEDTKRLNDSTSGIKKSGIVILGSGVVKHSILNAHLYRNGADYAIYINTAQEYDGSDAGAVPDEAVSWGKIKPNAKSIKIYGDATILFPLLVAESFALVERRY